MIVLKVNSPTIRERIKKAGLELCICCEFTDAVWLTMKSTEIHGEGYPFEELDLYNVEDVLSLFEKETSYIDCGYDVEKFIRLCKEKLNKN